MFTAVCSNKHRVASNTEKLSELKEFKNMSSIVGYKYIRSHICVTKDNEKWASTYLKNRFWARVCKSEKLNAASDVPKCFLMI